MSRGAFAIAGLVISCAWAGAVAHAQPAENPDRLIDRGIQARSRGRDGEALELFQRAHAIRPNALSLAQMALAEQALGRWLEADEHLRAAMAMEDRWVTRNRATLQEARSAIEQHVGSLRVDGTPAGATVSLAEREIGTLPMAEPARVLVGRARLAVRAEGHEPVQREIDIRPGETLRETVTLAATASASPPPVEPEVRRPRAPPARRERSGGGSALTTIGIAGLGVGGAALVTGTVALVLREGHVSDWNSDACLRDARTRGENCQADADAADTAGAVSVVGFVAGGALVAGSLVLLLVGSSGGDADDGAGAGRSDEGARVLGCGTGPGTIGVSCAGRF